MVKKAAPPPVCPTPRCGQPLRRHCPSHTCTWWACLACRSFGYPGTARWIRRDTSVQLPPDPA